MKEKQFNYVYLTTNLINGKQYVGDHSTNNLNDHYLGSGIYFDKAILKYGKENFSKQILEQFNTKECSFDAQEKYINEYNTLIPNGYNISPKGGSKYQGSCSEETKKKLSKIWKGRKHSEESKLKMGRPGRKHSEESKKKMSESQKGKIISEETKKKMSESHKGILKGRKASNETKNKLSKLRKGKPSPNKGKKMSEEAKLKISIAKKGKKLSEEHKKNISINNGMRNKGYLVSGERNGMYQKCIKKMLPTKVGANGDMV